MSYRPHKSGNVAKFIQFLKDSTDVTAMGSHEISALTGIPVDKVSTCLKKAVAAEYLNVERSGGANSWSLGSRAGDLDEGALPEANAAGDQQPFGAALDSDGELFMRGFTLTEDGGALLSRESTTKLVLYLQHTGGWIAHVPAASE